MLNAPLPDKAQNVDIVLLVTQAMRFCEEFSNSASASRDETTQHDIRRMRDTLGFFSSRFAVFRGEPELDTPHYHPHATDVPQWPALGLVQNADVQGVINNWAMLITEMANCGSAERSSGFSPADSGRVEAILQKIAILVDTIEADPEVDLPDARDTEPAPSNAAGVRR
jgi:hypothetical protein